MRHEARGPERSVPRLGREAGPTPVVLARTKAPLRLRSDTLPPSAGTRWGVRGQAKGVAPLVRSVETGLAIRHARRGRLGYQMVHEGRDCRRQHGEHHSARHHGGRLTLRRGRLQRSRLFNGTDNQLKIQNVYGPVSIDVRYTRRFARQHRRNHRLHIPDIYGLIAVRVRCARHRIATPHATAQKRGSEDQPKGSGLPVQSSDVHVFRVPPPTLSVNCRPFPRNR